MFSFRISGFQSIQLPKGHQLNDEPVGACFFFEAVGPDTGGAMAKSKNVSQCCRIAVLNVESRGQVRD